MPIKKINNFPRKLKIKYDTPSIPIRTIIGRSSLAERKKRWIVAKGLSPTLAVDDIYTKFAAFDNCPHADKTLYTIIKLYPYLSKEVRVSNVEKVVIFWPRYTRYSLTEFLSIPKNTIVVDDPHNYSLLEYRVDNVCHVNYQTEIMYWLRYLTVEGIDPMAMSDEFIRKCRKTVSRIIRSQPSNPVKYLVQMKDNIVSKRHLIDPKYPNTDLNFCAKIDSNTIK